jgi:hypothetical protein
VLAIVWKTFSGIQRFQWLSEFSTCIRPAFAGVFHIREQRCLVWRYSKSNLPFFDILTKNLPEVAVKSRNKAFIGAFGKLFSLPQAFILPIDAGTPYHA